jgi:hypothetical protein
MVINSVSTWIMEQHNHKITKQSTRIIFKTFTAGVAQIMVSGLLHYVGSHTHSSTT